MITTTIRIESWRRSGRNNMLQNRHNRLAGASVRIAKTAKH